MPGKLLPLTVMALLLNALAAAPARANPKEEKQAAFIKKVKTSVARLGTGEAARVEVKLRDKTKLRGYVGEANADYFTVVGAAGLPTRVAYPQVAGVKGHNLSEGVRIAIVAGILAAAIIIALGAAAD